MASYIVLEPAEAGTEKAEAAVLIRDGFSVLALILPLIWFLWHRMWLEAVAFLAIGLAVGGLGALIDSTYLSTALSLLLALLVGLEAQSLRVASLRRRGWREWGVVEGANREEAEWRYANEIAQSPQRPAEAPPAAPAARAAPAGPRAAGPAFGLIDYPRKS